MASSPGGDGGAGSFGNDSALGPPEVIARHRDEELDRARVRAADKVEREVVKQLVRQQAAGGGGWDILQSLRRGQASGRQRPPSRRPSFDRHELHRGASLRVECTEHLGGEGAIARPRLDEPKGSGPSQERPQLFDLTGHQRAEHRREVRAGDEIAGRSHRQPRVVAAWTVQGELHEPRERDGTVGPDGVCDGLRRCPAGRRLRWAGGGCLRTHACHDSRVSGQPRRQPLMSERLP